MIQIHWILRQMPTKDLGSVKLPDLGSVKLPDLGSVKIPDPPDPGSPTFLGFWHMSDAFLYHALFVC